MSSENYHLRHSGIYRNLPQFDPSIKDLKAIICGASGISGFNTLRALLDSPYRWSKICTLSRSPLSPELLALLTEERKSKLQHLSVDLNSSRESVAQSLKEAGVDAEYVFFYSYLQPKTGESGMSANMTKALVQANVPLLDNFLQALPQAGIRQKRILLQTGGKDYGLPGGIRLPGVESDPRTHHTMFYPLQQDLLFEYCKANPGASWNVICPSAIVGATASAAMNFFYPFGVYAAVQANKGEPLKFGGDFKSWEDLPAHSTALLTGFLSEWAVLEDKCADQAFNANDGGPLSWDRLFSELARWYDVPGVEGPELDDSKFQVEDILGGQESALGYGPTLKLRRTYRLEDWAHDGANKAEWERMKEASDGQLTANPYEADPGESFVGDFCYVRFGMISMNKARMYGFSGFVDTLESMFSALQDFTKLGMLPPVKVESARPLV